MFYDLAIVDPPYGIGESSKKYESRHTDIIQKNGTKSKIRPPKYKEKNWDDEVPDQSYFDELFRVSKHQIIWGCNYFDFDQKKNSSGRIFWDKVNYDNDFSDGEIAWTDLHSSVRQIELLWNGHMQAASIENGRRQQGNKKLNQERIHQTEKPFLLYQWVFKKYSKPDWKHLDTHSGSASIAVVADRMGLELDCCEKDLDHYTDSIERFKKLTGNGLFK